MRKLSISLCLLFMVSTFVLAQEEVVKVGGGSVSGMPSLFEDQLANFSFARYPEDMRLEVSLLRLGGGAVDTTYVFNGLLKKSENARVDVSVGRKGEQYLVMCMEFGSNIALYPVKTSAPVAFYPLPAPKNQEGRTVFIGLFMEEKSALPQLEKALPVNDRDEAAGLKLLEGLPKEGSYCHVLTYKLSEP